MSLVIGNRTADSMVGTWNSPHHQMPTVYVSSARRAVRVRLLVSEMTGSEIQIHVVEIVVLHRVLEIGVVDLLDPTGDQR